MIEFYLRKSTLYEKINIKNPLVNVLILHSWICCFSNSSLSWKNSVKTWFLFLEKPNMPLCEVGKYQKGVDATSNNNGTKIFYRTYGQGPVKVLLIIGILRFPWHFSMFFLFWVLHCTIFFNFWVIKFWFLFVSWMILRIGWDA